MMKSAVSDVLGSPCLTKTCPGMNWTSSNLAHSSLNSAAESAPPTPAFALPPPASSGCSNGTRDTHCSRTLCRSNAPTSADNNCVTVRESSARQVTAPSACAERARRAGGVLAPSNNTCSPK
eukprot:CAMPEP_0180077470 /NCGR_PEP_ID=MMETSP0985-20121206/15717_1 /TAXON_ID=483367 /ORGANISM="non described non described, Strain CCMP 2436" /LENGTH=121 /DNA_ID=CAMNT_0022009811 /DNA_START=772 /DNA_END=1137 /DNA_ORIENTATION=+